MANKLLYHFFDDDDFLMISGKIKEIEKITSGEIRVALKDSLSFRERNKSIKELAGGEFIRLGMHDTRDKTGILLYINLKLRKFYILADDGINNKVEQETWNNIAAGMEADFQIGQYTMGIIKALDKVGSILNEHFPIMADDTNELSNKVIV
ncbi:MAG: TPM domain-containing protein [Melioribacteraceae bacterium]|nr:TPM domain-containing protein [Melioribacteraceae bacterium]